MDTAQLSPGESDLNRPVMRSGGGIRLANPADIAAAKKKERQDKRNAKSKRRVRKVLIKLSAEEEEVLERIKEVTGLSRESVLRHLLESGNAAALESVIDAMADCHQARISEVRSDRDLREIFDEYFNKKQAP
jgi:hypothetical protein